jgi:uncharacterized protein
MDRFDELRDAVVPLLEPYGLKRLAVFGSYARGDEGPESDIDLLVEFEDPPKQRLGLFQWFGLEREMGQRLGREVDLVDAGTLKPRVRPHVEKDLRVVYDEAE